MEKVSQPTFLEFVQEHFLESISDTIKKKGPIVKVADEKLFLAIPELNPDEIPMINLAVMYKVYQKTDEELELYVKRCASNYEKMFIDSGTLEKVNADHSHTIDKEDDTWRSRVFISITSKTNDFSNIPHLQKGDYILFCQYGLGKKNSLGAFDLCQTVTYGMLHSWNTDLSTLMDVAGTNSQIMFPGRLQSISSIDDGYQMYENRMFVLTNNYHFNGAAALFYEPEILRNMSSAIGNKNFVLFPSGNSEIICLAIQNNMEWKGYQQLFDDFKAAVNISNGLGSKIMLMDCERNQIRQLDGVSFSPNLSQPDRKMVQTKKM
ncbi:MAG: hypothetical protein E7222_12860 [Clostridiales bacterium]|nr:hypothetical protein [Clostridiales bacterium]